MTSSKHTARIEKILSSMRRQKGLAIKTDQSTLTFKELLDRIDQISDFLRNNVEPYSIVAVIGTPSWEICAYFLAIINAKCAALILDASWSPEWISDVLADANPTLTFALDKNSTKGNIYVPDLGIYASKSLKTPARVDKNAAYIIYTSGTTSFTNMQ